MLVGGIAIAGVLTTILMKGRSAVRTGANATSKFAKAVYNLGKKLGGFIAPVLSALSTILSWGAKGVAFLANNLWILVVFLVYVADGEGKDLWNRRAQ